eukprot:Skav227903  [mRNA]  locus=scaffold146:19384:20348:+ [translate_table: standard]
MQSLRSAQLSCPVLNAANSSGCGDPGPPWSVTPWNLVAVRGNGLRSLQLLGQRCPRRSHLAILLEPSTGDPLDLCPDEQDKKAETSGGMYL